MDATVNKGKLIINEFGNGFVNMPDKIVYINKFGLNNAFDGEEVEFTFYEKEGNYYGTVVNYSLLNKVFIGTVHHHFHKYTYIYCDELKKSNLIEIETPVYLEKNRWVKVQIISQNNGKLQGQLMAIYSYYQDIIIQEKWGLNNIDSLPISSPASSDTIDQTSLNTFTIDPESSQDCDDAFSIEYISNEEIRVYVHISDVAHWINPDTVSSEDFDVIMKRGNTYYGDSQNWTMIPRNYADNICSILPNKETRVVTNEFIYNKMNGTLEFVKWYYSKVISKHKWHYDYVDAVMEYERDFSTIYETSLIIGKSIPDFNLTQDTKSHSMVKYWMIHVNNIMCKEVARIYRANPKPDESKFSLIKTYLGNFQVTREELVELAPHTPIYRFMLKALLTKAYYTTANSYHYGIGIDNYTHWTSPIRRSVDLLNHLILKGYQFTEEKLAEYLQWANEAEIVQDKIEGFIQKYKNMNIVNVGDKFCGIIIGVFSTGISVYIEGLDEKYMIHISKLSKNRLIYDKEMNTLENQEDRYRMFNIIQVIVVNKDVEKIDFEPVF